MAIIIREVDYFTFSQELFKGKEIFNKKTNKALLKWESYHICKGMYDDILNNNHTVWGCRDKEGYQNGVYRGRLLKQIQKYWKNKSDN